MENCSNVTVNISVIEWGKGQEDADDDVRGRRGREEVQFVGIYLTVCDVTDSHRYSEFY